jgi:hypothetical protein
MSGLFDDLSSLVSAMRRDEYSPRHGIPVSQSSLPPQGSPRLVSAYLSPAGRLMIDDAE